MLDVTILNKVYTKPTLKQTKYWVRHNNIFRWLSKSPIKSFKKTFPHDICHQYCLDDEDLINHLAKWNGWRVVNEDIHSCYSTYEFKRR